MRITIAFAVMALVTLTSGCGTVRNLCDDQPRAYGGVAKDAEFFLGSLGSWPACDSTGATAILALCAAEVCASAVADTLTYPFLYHRHRRVREPLETKALDEESLRPQYSAGASVPPP